VALSGVGCAGRRWTWPVHPRPTPIPRSPAAVGRAAPEPPASALYVGRLGPAERRRAILPPWPRRAAGGTWRLSGTGRTRSELEQAVVPGAQATFARPAGRARRLARAYAPQPEGDDVFGFPRPPTNARAWSLLEGMRLAARLARGTPAAEPISCARRRPAGPGSRPAPPSPWRANCRRLVRPARVDRDRLGRRRPAGPMVCRGRGATRTSCWAGVRPRENGPGAKREAGGSERSPRRPAHQPACIDGGDAEQRGGAPAATAGWRVGARDRHDTVEGPLRVDRPGPAAGAPRSNRDPTEVAPRTAHVACAVS